jgi:uncharacterized damage-inducible protein DinB
VKGKAPRDRGPDDSAPLQWHLHNLSFHKAKRRTRQKRRAGTVRSLNLAACLVLAVGFAAIPAPSQDSGKKGDSNKTPSKVRIVLAQWNEIGRKLVAMAEDFPEDKYDFKPTPAQRSFADQLLHVAGSNYLFTDPVRGRTPNDDESRANHKTKADIVAYLKNSFEDGAAAISAKGDNGLGDWVTDPESRERVQVVDLAYGMIEHSGEHYGQLAVYFRVAGMVPPESRPKK